MENVTEKIAFDFTKNADVIRACQLSAEHSINQSLPMPNILGLQRAANSAMRLAELQLRYSMFKEKMKKSGGESVVTVPLLELSLIHI